MLDSVPDSMPREVLKPLLVIEFVLWSQQVAARQTTRPFWGWLKAKIEKSEAFMLAEHPEADESIRVALGLTVVKPQPKRNGFGRPRKVQTDQVAA